MADGAAVGQRVDLFLESVLLMLGDLPEIAEEWSELHEGERVSWSLDWDQAMGTNLRFLNVQYHAGTMTEQQCARYRELLRRLKEHWPIIQRLGLYPPPVPLEV